MREVLAVLARDEHAHAELAWGVVRWCCAAGDPSVARHVRALADRLPDVAAPLDTPAALHATLARHGWLAPQAWREIARRTRRDVAARAAHLGAEGADEHASAFG